MILTKRTSYMQMKSEFEREVEDFFDNHIHSLEEELAYRDVESIQKYLKDGVFAVQYSRFLSRLSNKIKFDLKKLGKEYLEEHYGDHEDYLDTVIRFSKDVDKFYVQQEQLAIQNSPIEINKAAAITKGVSAGVLTTALTFSLAALIFRTPILITSLASALAGTGLGSKVYSRDLLKSREKAKKEEKAEIINQVSIGLHTCKIATLKNINDVMFEYNEMFHKFIERLDSNAISSK